MGKRKLTHEEFIKRVLQKNKYYVNGGFDIVGEYVNYHTSIECYCSKHDLYWNPTPASLCDGWGCPSCGAESTANHKRLTHEDFIAKLSKSNEHYTNGEFIIKTQYIGSDKFITCYCIRHDLDWTTIPNHLYKGCGCPECGKEIVSKKTKQKLKDIRASAKKDKTNAKSRTLSMDDIDFGTENKSTAHEIFLNKLSKRNKYYSNGNFDVVGQYIKSNSSILCHCNIHNIEWITTPSILLKGHRCPNCGYESRVKNRVLTHEDFLKNLLQLNQHYANGDFSVVGQYTGVYEPIECYCNIHNISWNNKPSNLYKGSRCPYCCGKKTIKGFNDMWTTRPDIAGMLQDPEDGYRYTAYSNRKAWFICPDCGTPSIKTVVNVSYHNFGCQHCSDSVSYPNKFGRALLDQLPIDGYDYEYQPDWAKPYYYDNHFYYNGIEYILEMDGDFHFKEQQVSRNTLEQVQARDRLKDELASEHGVYMIRIDCIRSEMEYIKSHILDSELKDVFDLSNIDWVLCDQKAQKNILKEACKLYMSNQYTLKEIGKILQVHPSTVSKYLQRGTKFGWSDYSPIKSKAIAVIDDDGNIIHSFNSMAECNREMKRLYNITFSNKYLRNACKTHESYHGFNFRFANEFNNSNNNNNN